MKKAFYSQTVPVLIRILNPNDEIQRERFKKGDIVDGLFDSRNNSVLFESRHENELCRGWCVMWLPDFVIMKT